jgi:hypothetical protein
MVNSSIANLNYETMQKVVNFFTSHAVGTADEIGASGSFMTSLRNRGMVRIAGTKTVFVMIDEYRELYKKTEINLYELARPLELIKSYYNTECERQAMIKKERAKEVIEGAKTLLEVADELLTRCL